MWIVLAQLDMLERAETWRDEMFGFAWDTWLAENLHFSGAHTESVAQRALLRMMMKGLL